MELNDYQKKAIETAVYNDKYKIIYPALGLGDEAGEVLGKVKKWLRGDDGGVEGEMSEERKQALKLEIGDVLWYLAILTRDLGYDFNDVAESNLEKLKSRNERGAIKGSGDYR